MDDLLDAIRAVCADSRAREVPEAAGLSGVERALDGLGAPRRLAPKRLAVVEAHLAGAVAGANDPLARRLGEAVLAAGPALSWGPSTSYRDAPHLRAFLAGYAVTLVAGPDFKGYPTPYSSDRVMFGLSLQAPNLFYPAHAHAAVEIYYVIGGAADWQQGDGVWRRLASGALVRHEPDEPHAMETRDEPLLALFAWISDLESRPRFVDPPDQA